MQESSQPGSPTRFETHISIHPEEQSMPGALCQHPARVLFAAPSRRQGGRQLQAHAGIQQAEGADPFGGTIAGMVIEHHHLQLGSSAAALKRAPHGLLDTSLLIAGGDQHRNLRPVNRCELS